MRSLEAIVINYSVTSQRPPKMERLCTLSVQFVPILDCLLNGKAFSSIHTEPLVSIYICCLLLSHHVPL